MHDNEQDFTTLAHDMIVESAPERREELERLWHDHAPTFAQAGDKKGFTMEAGAFELIIFNERTMAQCWLLGFAAWHAFEAYCPYSLLRIALTPSAMQDDPGLAEAEAILTESVRKAGELREVENLNEFRWPNVPIPSSIPPVGEKDRAVADLVKIATAFAFLHEVKHVVFKAAPDRPENAKEEELECDRFARHFLLEKSAQYSAETCQNQQGVLDKRLMGIIVGAYIVLEVTPEAQRGGSDTHPNVAERLRNLILDSAPHTSEHVWVFACCLLLGKLRGEMKLPPSLDFGEPRVLFEQLVGLL